MTGPRFDAAVVAAALGVARVTFLGAGAFGDTWRVGDHAVKIICVDGYPPARVAREVDGLTRVDSPHVVKLLRTGSVRLGGAHRPALTFEFVQGGDLQRRIDGGERPTPEESVALLLGLLRGVRDLHAAQGTVHRDIKPQNVVLRDGDWATPVLLDLGLAKATTESTFTMYPGHVGTTAYMAPEQLRGHRARKAADLFAVGVTVRACLNGRHPFYQEGRSYNFDEAVACIEKGPAPLTPNLPPNASRVLNLLVSSAEHDRGSATSNLRRLEAEQ